MKENPLVSEKKYQWDLDYEELKEMLERAASNGDEITFEDFYFIMTKKTFA